MSATAIKIKDQGLATEPEETCKVVVFYENTAARSAAMSVCDRLVGQFAEDLDFEFRWWKFERLTDALLGRHATEAAQTADIVMFCPQGGELPVEAADWVEHWSGSGVALEGALALVLPANVDPAGAAEKMVHAFRAAAQRLGMDFLPVSIPAGLPVNNTALRPVPFHEPAHTYHWGLNE